MLSTTPYYLQLQSSVKTLKELLESEGFTACELCEKLFVRTEEQKKNYKWTCQDCTPCAQCREEREVKDESHPLCIHCQAWADLESPADWSN